MDNLTKHLDNAQEHMDKAKSIIDSIDYIKLTPTMRKVYYFRTDQLINDSKGELECKLYAGQEDGIYGIYLASGHILAESLQEAKNAGYERVGRTHLMIKCRD